MVFKVIELTNNTFNDIMNWPVSQVFTLTCYALDKAKLDELQIKQWKATH